MHAEDFFRPEKSEGYGLVRAWVPEANMLNTEAAWHLPFNRGKISENLS
jgi:hypothetical protein